MDWQGLRFLGESPVDGYVLQNCTYSPSLVALAFLVACLAGYTALDMVARVGTSLSHPRLWQWIGAVCLGSGSWATHFVAMLAFHAPIALRYDLPITGLSLLLLFVAMAQLIGWPQERGIVTIGLAHTSVCSSYVAVVVSARLRDLALSIEEAAMDLGAKPWKVFLLITIPMIAPSLAAGGMMSFALSLDDLVLASFVSGPGSTTLPMEVFSAVRLGVKPEINAVASLILLSVSLFTFFAWYFTRQAEERRRRAIQQAMEETATDWQKGSPTPA